MVVLDSNAKINHINDLTNCLNQKFPPQLLKGENMANLTSYFKTCIDLGVHHIQFNIIDRDLLLDAQKGLEIYSTIVVRVAGHSPCFTDLNRNFQNQIIDGTAQEL